jgi:hypothetical protein
VSDPASVARPSLEYLVSEWEDDHSLLDTPQLFHRMEVLDQLDRFFPDTDEHHRYSSFGPALCRRARALSARMETANSKLCESIRSQIRCGAGATEFLGVLERLGCDTTPLDRARGMSYDGLDEFMSGVLQFEKPGTEKFNSANPYMVAYQPTPARHIFSLIARASIVATDVLVDLGSGLGHVPLLVSLCTGAFSIGIEIEANYIASARQSAERLNLRAVRFLHQNAEEADLSVGTIFYLYTPFTGAVLRTVMELLRRQAAVRQIKICSLGPGTRALADTAWLEPTTNPKTDQITVFVPRC